MKTTAPRLSIALVTTALLSGCAATRPETHAATPIDEGPSRSSVPQEPFVVRMFDVGTGLSILVTGDDFSLLYDAGSNDDRRTGRGDRAVAYLEAVLGPSGPSRCADREGAPDVAERTIDHVFLSHPHRDHVSFMPDVLACFAVKNVWDSGKESDTEVYGAFVEAARREPGAKLHSGRLDGAAEPAREGERIELGRGATATILSVRPDAKDPNDASIVVRLDLGRVSVLLTGDATGGERRDPSAPPAKNSVEADLLARHRRSLGVDILQVGHHGSETSSRSAFLDAVSPRFALVSAGPTPYGRVVLPDAEVTSALAAHGARVLRTDENDEGCRTEPAKMGPDADGSPGGCSAVTLRIDRAGAIHVEPGPLRD